MNEADIKSRILRYLDDGFEDTDYIAEIVNSQTFSKLSSLICHLLQAPDFNTFHLTALFLRDAILYGNRNGACHQFIVDYPGSAIVTTLEKLVFSDNHFIKNWTIYTLGKTCSYRSKDVLIQAFDRYKDSDPLLLNRLIHEMGWLGVENIENCLEQMITSSSYLTRWAAVEHIYQSEDRLPDWAEILRRDKCEFIRAEAEYECQRILQSIQTSTLSKAERRQRAKEIKKIDPKISFQHVSTRFSSHLFSSGLSQYTVIELETYVNRIMID
jgi:hypothetical protein